jgi:hypothetical protein
MEKCGWARFPFSIIGAVGEPFIGHAVVERVEKLLPS